MKDLILKYQAQINELKQEEISHNQDVKAFLKNKPTICDNIQEARAYRKEARNKAALLGEVIKDLMAL